jgi:transcriptional repressor NrdR
VKCLYCNSDTSVINSRLQKRANQVWRRRQCKACKAVFTTLEAVELPLALFVDSRGRSEPFLPDKLYTEILLALQDHKDAYIAAREVSNTVIMQLLKLPEKPFFPRTAVSAATAKVLRRFDGRAYLRYVSEHPSLQQKAP